MGYRDNVSGRAYHLGVAQGHPSIRNCPAEHWSSLLRLGAAMAKRLTVAQSSELLAAYRKTFDANSHGEALKSMYSTFEAKFGVPRGVLAAEVAADRQANTKLYRKLQNRLIQRAATRKTAGPARTESKQVLASKNSQNSSCQQATNEEAPKQTPVRCPECNRKLAHSAIHHYGKRGRSCSGGASAARRTLTKPTPMAETLAKWNIELECEYVRPEGQRIQNLVVNLDTGKWQTTGVLGALGYHVGAQGVNEPTRRAILNEAFEVKLIAASQSYVEYVQGWGPPRSRQRLTKIRDSIRSFAKIRRSAKADYSAALADWDRDLAWFRAKYQV
jgi:hypothetical protein